MYEFSAGDGFVEISENLGDMIKYVANEPSLGLYYVQQHVQHAVPNVISLKNHVAQNSHATVLHTEDLEDSIAMVSSMKECGFPIADEMIGDIKRSLAIMSTRRPIRGLIQPPNSMFPIGRTSSWASTALGYNANIVQKDGETMGSYLSGVLKSAKQKAGNFKWPQIDLKESREIKGEAVSFHPMTLAPVGSTSSTLPDEEGEELPLSSHVDVIEEDTDIYPEGELQHPFVLSTSDNYEEFKADREAKLEEWLEGSNSSDHKASDNKTWAST
ncbi:hypothetical protein Ancab_023575 [Ancistrocladus abbreviatus]